MKAILITLAAGILVASFQQYRVATRDTEIATLKATVERQNGAIEKLAADAKLANADAGNRAAAVLLEGEKQKHTLPQGYGHAVMNQWFDEAFQ